MEKRKAGRGKELAAGKETRCVRLRWGDRSRLARWTRLVLLRMVKPHTWLDSRGHCVGHKAIPRRVRG